MTRLVSSRRAAEILGVSVSTVKRWSDEGHLKCRKTAGRHRRFTRSDLEDFLHGVTSGTPTNPDIQRWLGLLRRETDPAKIRLALLEERIRLGSWHCLADHFGGVLSEIGRQWLRRDCSVAHEHIISRRLEIALAQCSSLLDGRSTGARCVLVTAEDDPHTLGLSLAELCVREAGWTSIWLGAGISRQELIGYLNEDPVELVAVSASDLSADRAKLVAYTAAVARTCRRQDIRLVLGGSGRWPDAPAYGHRLAGFSELAALLTRLRPLQG